MNALLKSGYQYPTNPNVRGSISKYKSVLEGLGSITLRMIDADGNPVEEWFLKNPWIADVDFGGTLGYDQDGMSELSLTIQYDWAEIVTSGPSA
jgi:hypothetical protein